TRDKDAISSAALICEMAAVAKEDGKTLYEALISLYSEYGLYKERLLSITRKGRNGANEIAEMMETFRKNPPQNINGEKVVKIADYQSQEVRNIADGTTESIDLPQSNVLQFFLSDGSKISARPSGTEPKIKFYFSVTTPLDNKADFDATQRFLEKRIDAIIADLGISK